VDAVGTALPRIARPELARKLAGALETGSVLLVAGAGYGKSMALEEAIELSGRRAVWVGCRDAGGEAGRLLIAAVEGLRAAVPGLADVLGDRLAAGVEQLDVRSAATALLAELERLMVEPLVIVFDDAEELEGDEPSLALVDRLLSVRGAPLSLAIATRRPLELTLSKLRAGGRLVEVGPAELAFTASECEELLRLRHGRAVSDEEVEAAVAASEGWPMGVALTGLAGPGETATAVPREELFGFLAEEVLNRLDPEMRLALVDSSVPATLTPELLEALGLEAGFLADAERLGLFLRTNPSGARSYHPLFRAFLLERLGELRTDGERAALHARAAVALAAAGRDAEAIDHWLQAGRYREGLALLASRGLELMRTSAATVARWLEQFPPELRRDADYRFLEGQLLWSAGRHREALEPLRAAVLGYGDTPYSEREWLARSFLADAFVSGGLFAEIDALAVGWDAVTHPRARTAATAVAWYQAIGLVSRGLPRDARALAERLRSDSATAERFRWLDAVVRVALEPAAGRGRATLAWLEETITRLEHDDPHARLPYALAMAVLVLRDLGERAAVFEYLDRCERASERLGMGFVARDCRLQRAFLLAEDGDLSGAEIELARVGQRRGAGWRGVHRAQAQAQVAALRGDAPAATAAAQRALERVAPGPVCYRVWAAVELAPLLAETGAAELAGGAVDRALAALDDRFPGERGRLHRARLLATRAFLDYGAGRPGAACESVRLCWREAGGEADQIVRAHWRTLRPVLWHALERGAVAPEVVLPAVQAAFPGGEALVAMVDHPDAYVRRAALLTALTAGHPTVLAQLGELARDGDDQVAAAARAATERLRLRPPPLRFELLGGFRVKRGGWTLDEGRWKRPMAARVVRFLLIRGPGAVPEDELFDAFWPDRDAESARQHLAVAVSRARKVLDLPGAEESVIEAKERTYRLRLRERDSLDSASFTTAAERALAEGGRERRAALESAAGLWTGDPLPEDRYAPWSFDWREQLVETYSQVLSALAETYERSGEHHEAIRTARALLEVDPLNEGAHRQLMVAYARTGRTSYALRQFLECRRALVVELGVEPAAETARLQARILAGEAV
jgi:DNA-binding SARP family transcriptional activator